MGETKEQIILTFLRLHALTGRASLGDVASEVGIKKASIYSHFKDAEDLENSAYEYCQNLISQKKFQVNFKAQGPEELLTDLIHSFANIFATEPLFWYYSILNQKKLFDSHCFELYSSIELMLNARVQVALEYCVQEGWLNIKNTDYASFFLSSAIKEKLPVSANDWEFEEIAHRFVLLEK